MRYKTKEVEQHKVKYRVFDKIQKKVCAEYDDLCVAAAFCKYNTPVSSYGTPYISYTMKTELDVSSYRWEVVFGKHKLQKYDVPAPKYVILNEFGDVVTKEQIEQAYKDSYTPRLRKWNDPVWENIKYVNNMRLVCPKGSSKKIKKTYQKTYRQDELYGHHFSEKIWTHYRTVKTYGEIKKACADANEYGEGIVKAKRRWHSIPDYWDEYPSDVYKTSKSWKHNSKRRKQWIPK